MKMPRCATIWDTHHQPCIRPQRGDVWMASFQTGACEREWVWWFSGMVKNQQEKLAVGWEGGAVPAAVMPRPPAGDAVGVGAGGAEAGAETLPVCELMGWHCLALLTLSLNPFQPTIFPRARPRPRRRPAATCSASRSTARTTWARRRAGLRCRRGGPCTRTSPTDLGRLWLP